MSKVRPRRADLPPLRQLLVEDLRRQGWNATRPGFQALAVQRMGSWLALRRLEGGPLRPLWTTFFVLLELFRVAVIRNLYGVELHYGTYLGRRVQFTHQHGITVHHLSSIDDDSVIHQNVTLGRGARASRGAPQVGKRVEISPGAVLLGPIIIGDDTVIGPNAIVMTNVPPNSHVVNPPGRVMRLQGRADES